MQTCPRCQGLGRDQLDPCPDCRGEGKRRLSERIRVSIPQGVNEGSKVRLAGKGEPGLNGGPPGDLYIVVRLKPHHLLERKDEDLYMDLPVTVHEALAGKTITVPTLHGDVKVKIPPGTQSGKRLRIRGKGVHKRGDKGRGDLYLRVIVRVPDIQDKEAVEAASKLDRYYRKNLREDMKF